LTAPCYLCGKPSVLEGLCADCYNNNHPLIDVSTPLTLLACKKCSSVKLPDGWQKIAGNAIAPEEIQDYQIELLLGSMIKTLGKDVTLSIEEEKRLDRVTHIIVTASGKSHESLSPHDEKYSVEIRYRLSTCDTCGMMHGGYYEAILQIRADSRELTDEEKQAISSTVTDITVGRYRSDDRAFIVNTIENKYGLDFYIGSENLCKLLADEIETQYLAERKENYKLIGEDRTGRRKYRITVLVRLPQFLVGDFVTADGNPCQVLAMSRNMLTCYDLKRRERFSINPKSAKWRTLEFLAPLSSRREFMITTSAYGKPVQIMDSSTFEVQEIEPSLFDSEIVVGSKIYALKIEDDIYILPNSDDFKMRS
jgi:nonsense-mediated mRNA decay protein 3